MARNKIKIDDQSRVFIEYALSRIKSKSDKDRLCIELQLRIVDFFGRHSVSEIRKIYKDKLVKGCLEHGPLVKNKKRVYSKKQLKQEEAKEILDLIGWPAIEEYYKLLKV